MGLSTTNFDMKTKKGDKETKKDDTQKKHIHQENDLDTAFQKFNPSTSPPMNDFMERLAARTLSYYKN